MSNIYDMEGKKKVIFTEEPDVNITYKEIMQIVVGTCNRREMSSDILLWWNKYVSIRCIRLRKDR